MHNPDQPWMAVAAGCACVLVAVLAWAPPPVMAQDSGASNRGRGNAIVVRAREAWESEDGSVLYVRGNLTLRAPDWQLSAEEGRIEGRLTDPDVIAVNGSPARIIVQRARDKEPFEGTGERVEFRPNADAVKLRGDALVVKGQQSIQSGQIDYGLDDGTFSAGLGGRVRVVTTPKVGKSR